MTPTTGTPTTGTVLVADPDRGVRQTVSELCDAQDFALVYCEDGASALYQAGRIAPDVILLSAELPHASAAEVIGAIRRYSDVPIVLGVGAAEADCAAASLAAGATAVLSRPYQGREVQSLLGHLARPEPGNGQHDVLVLGTLELDGPAYQVRAAGKELELTVREFHLLRVLMLHADRVVSSDQIRQTVWGGKAASGNTIAVHVRRLRARLGEVGDIVNVRGVGYRLAVSDGPAPPPRAG